MITTFGLWCALILLQVLAAVRIYRTGLVARFPVFGAWFAVSAALSVMLLAIRQAEPAAYPPVFSAACLIGVLLEAGCIIEAFWALCGKFRKFRRIGGTLLIILWLIAGASSAAMRLSWIPAAWHQTWQLVVLGTRYADSAMVVVLAAAWILLRIPGLPIARSANRVTLIILGHSLYGLIASSLIITHNNEPYFWMSVIPLIGGCLTALAAATLLRTCKGEFDLPQAPSREEVVRHIRDGRLALMQFQQDAEDARKLLFDE